jgi:gas vesicle protein
MNNNLKERLNDLIQLCLDIPSITLQDAARSINRQVGKLHQDDMEAVQDLIDELMIHVNDLDQDQADEYQDILQEINDTADEIRDEFL